MINPMDMSGRTVLVTGASSGIGREVAILASRLGARVVLTARNESRLKETLSLLEGSDHRIAAFDLGSKESTNALPGFMAALAKEVGPFSGVVHCAGIQSISPLQAISSNELENGYQLNVTSAIMLAKAFRQRDVHREPASLVLFSSVMGLAGAAGRIAYSATKGAIISLTKSMALELVRDRIRVNCVAPGFVTTPMLQAAGSQLGSGTIQKIEALHPLGFGQPADVANAVAFLLADTSRWITGTTLVVDGGYTAQ